MLNLTASHGDTVLMYDLASHKLLGAVTVEMKRGEQDNTVDTKFRMSDKVLVLREALVRKETDDISTCPQCFIDRFSNKRKAS